MSDAEPQPPQPTKPEPERHIDAWLALIVAVALIVVGGPIAFSLMRPAHTEPPPRVIATSLPSPYESAMRKAGVSAPAEPSSPVALSSVRALGSHYLDATFSYEELAALFRDFPLPSTPASPSLSLPGLKLAVDARGVLTATTSQAASGTAALGSVTGRVMLSRGKLVARKPLAFSGSVDASITSAADPTRALLDRANTYLLAVPGLVVRSASIGPEGVHVIGSAADTISWP